MLSFPIPIDASPSEKWILFVLKETGGIKPAAREVRRSVRRVQQVVAKYKITIVND